MAIYKYVVSDRLDVLENLKIRFTQADDLNDPFELKPVFKYLAEKDEIKKATLQELKKLLEERVSSSQEPAIKAKLIEITNNFETWAVSSDAASTVDLHIDRFMKDVMPSISTQAQESLQNQLANGIGILSLTEVPDSNQHWALYAENHKGFVFIFDEKSKFFSRKRSDSDEFYQLKEVSYLPDNYSGELCIADLDGSKLMYSKRPEWSWEKEWRVVAPLIDLEKTRIYEADVYLSALPLGAIVGVIIGLKMNTEKKEILFEIIRKNPSYASLKIYQSKIDLITGKLSHVLINE